METIQHFAFMNSNKLIHFLFSIFFISLIILTLSCKKLFVSEHSSILADKRLGPVYSFFISWHYDLTNDCIINPIPMSKESILDSVKFHSRDSIKVTELKSGFILHIDQTQYKEDLIFDTQSDEDLKIRWDKDLQISCKFQEETPANYHLHPYINISVPIIDKSGRYAIIFVNVPEHGGRLKIFELKSGLWTETHIHFPMWVY